MGTSSERPGKRISERAKIASWPVTEKSGMRVLFSEDG